MAEIYDEYSLSIPVFSAEAEQEAPPVKQCPGLQQFCPHYLSGVCDVKYRECVLFNSLQTSAMILRMERENLLKHPTPKNLEMVAQINEVLQEQDVAAEVDTVAIFRDKLRGRLTAGILTLAIVIVALILYLAR